MAAAVIILAGILAYIYLEETLQFDVEEANNDIEMDIISSTTELEDLENDIKHNNNGETRYRKLGNFLKKDKSGYAKIGGNDLEHGFGIAEGELVSSDVQNHGNNIIDNDSNQSHHK